MSQPTQTINVNTPTAGPAGKSAAIEQVATIQGPGSDVELSADGKVHINIGDAVTTDDIQVLQQVKDLTKNAAKFKGDKPENKNLNSDPDAVEEFVIQRDAKGKFTPKKVDPNQPAQTQADPNAKPTKTFKAEANGQALDLTADTLLEIPLKGRVEKVSVQDLVNEFNGKTAWDQKFQALAEYKKGVEAKDVSIKQYTREVQAAIESQNVDRMLRVALKYSGVDPQEAEKMIGAYYEKARDQILKYQQLTPAERELMQMKAKEAEREAEAKLSEQENAVQAEQNALVERITKAMEQSEMDQPTFVQRYDELQLFQKQNPHLNMEITPELVAQYHSDCVAYTKVYNSFSAFENGAELARNDGIVKYLRGQLQLNPGWSSNDLADVLKEALQPRTSVTAEESQAIKAKIQKNQPKVAGKTAKVSNASVRNQGTKGKPIYTFDDLETL